MKKRCRVLMAFALVLSMMFGMQVQAGSPADEAQVTITAFEGTDLAKVQVGDTVMFHMSMNNTTSEDLTGAGTRLVVTAADAQGNRMGEVAIPEEGNSASLGDRNNGQAVGIASAVMADFPSGKSINDAVASVKVTDDMEGKQITVQAVIKRDDGSEKPNVSCIAQTTFTVASKEIEPPKPEEPGITVTVVPSIDLNKGITKGEAFQATMKVTNSGNTVLQNIEADAAYSGKDPAMLEDEDFLRLGNIITKGDFTILDDGSAYLAELGVGETKELVFECMIPDEYAQDSVYLYFAAGSFVTENADADPVALDLAMFNSKVMASSKQDPAPNPNPTPKPDVKPDTKPTPEVKPADNTAKKEPAKTTAKSPKTGDESTAVSFMILLACAGIATVVAAKKKVES